MKTMLRIAAYLLVPLLALSAVLGILLFVEQEGSKSEVVPDQSILTQVERIATRVVKGRPSLTLRIWGQPRQSAFRVELFESGDLIVHRGRRAAQQLPAEECRRITELAQKAIGDFNSDGCGTVVEGTSADIEFFLHGKPFRLLCRNSPDWPRGRNTINLLDEINSHLSKDMRVY